MIVQYLGSDAPYQSPREMGAQSRLKRGALSKTVVRLGTSRRIGLSHTRNVESAIESEVLVAELASDRGSGHDGLVDGQREQVRLNATGNHTISTAKVARGGATSDYPK
jgi:hypothetical protein